MNIRRSPGPEDPADQEALQEFGRLAEVMISHMARPASFSWEADPTMDD
jgi:hypothetical protein